MQTGDSAMLKASYNVHRLIRRTFGQVPGGMFGADENAVWDISTLARGWKPAGWLSRWLPMNYASHDGRPLMAEHCEEVAFNSYPVA